MANKNYTELTLLRERLKYCHKTGFLYWRKSLPKHIPHTAARKSWNSKFAGEKAGCLKKDGYIRVFLSGRTYAAHRLAWALHYGQWPEKDIDHINGDKQDNRITNLRQAESCENCWNRSHGQNKKLPKGIRKRDSRYKHKKYSGRIAVHGRRYTTPGFATVAEAESALRELREKLHGEFCRHD